MRGKRLEERKAEQVAMMIILHHDEANDSTEPELKMINATKKPPSKGGFFVLEIS